MGSGVYVVFDRSHLHCSSSIIEGKKIGIATFTKNKMAIYDCFQFFNEEHIVDLRFNILNEYVDKFVIAESTVNHQESTKA